VALRRPLIVLRRKVRSRVHLTNGDRLFFVQPYRCSGMPICPLASAGFRRYWHWKSGSLGGRPRIAADLRALIWRMIANIASDDALILAHHANPARLNFREWHRFGLGLRTITQLFAIVKRAARASKQDRQNDFQNHSLPRCRDPDFPIHTLDLFPTNNADQRRSEGIQEAGQPSSFDISVPNCVCCSLRRRQVGLDVVVVALNERNDGRLKDRKGSRPRCRLAFAPYGCEPRLLVARTSRWAIVVSHLEEPGSSNEIAPGVEIEEAAIAAIAKAFLVVPSWV